jgi:PAS domain S-box-containing protein
VTMHGLTNLPSSAMQAYDVLSLPVWLFSIDTLEILASNPAAQTWLGFDAQTLQAMTIADMCPEEDRAQLIDRVRQFVETTTDAGIWTIVAKSGDHYSASFIWTKLIFDGTEAIVASIRDITRLQEAEEQVVEAARLQRFASQLARLGSWRVNLGQQSVIWDPGTANIHDEPEGISPTVDQAIRYYVPEHQEQIRALLRACIEHGHSFDQVLQVITAKGRRVWVRVIGKAVHDEVGLIIAVEGAFQDVSDLVAARDATQALSERLRNTLGDISDAFYLLDYDSTFLFLNGQAERLLQRSKDDLLGKSIVQEFPGSAGIKFQEHYQRAITTGQTVRFQEYFIPLKKWFTVAAHPTPEGLAVYFRDVTEQRARDEELRLLQTAVSHQNDILLITEAAPIDGPDGPKIVYVNNAFEKLTGFSREEAIGKSPRILQGPKTQRTELDRIRRAIEEQQSVRTEVVNYSKSGQEYWLEIDINPIANKVGLITHFVAVERDITKYRRKERALQVSEKRFRLMARATGSTLWELDIARNSQWWSEGLKEVFGHEMDRIEVPPTIWWTHVHPDDQVAGTEALDRLISGKTDTLYRKYRFQRADKSWARVEERAFVIRDEDGLAISVLGSITDISQRLELEERLHQAQKMEVVGQLTGGVAHDFNNLLTVMMGNAEILSDELSDQPDLQKLAAMTLRAADRGSELTNRLLAFSRKQPLQPQVLHLDPLIQGMETLLRRTLPENINIKIFNTGGLWKTEIDPSQIETALLNLTLNARDAMREGGGLTIETANASLDEDYVAKELDVKAGQYVMIVVTDTGHGIAPDVIGHIFEPFFTTKEVGLGSGLGLSMIYGFVKQSGGHISVYSEQGEGTTFRLYLPRLKANDAQDEIDRDGQKIVGGNNIILVVEDDALVRDYVIAQLNGLGYRTLEASNGAEALVLLNQHPRIDLLFTDVIMPGGMGGRELADAASALKPDLKVLFTSGYTENSIAHNGRLDAGVDLLSKPYRRDQLTAKVRKVLDDPH